MGAHGKLSRGALSTKSGHASKWAQCCSNLPVFKRSQKSRFYVTLPNFKILAQIALKPSAKDRLGGSRL